MSAERNDGGPAFPVADTQGAMPRTIDELKAAARGMSLRDHFAGQAMLVLALTDRGSFNPIRDADVCYEVADAMLKARAA
jgi:hypothetical protein